MKPIIKISEFKEGASVQGFYLCVEKHLRHTRSGDLYVDITLRDNSGKVNGKIWDKVEELNEKFSSGDPVAVRGEVESYQDKLQLVIKKINCASVQHYGRYGYDPALIIPTSSNDPEIMWSEIVKLIGSINNPHLKKIVSLLYKKHKNKLLIHPASVSMHHNYRHGFLEHTLSMAKLAQKISPNYNVDSDLVLAGVLLHDMGKLKEISEDLEAEYTDDGNFIGHIVMGRDIVRDAANGLKNFPEELQKKLEHIILAHQGKYEWQSPRLPAFLEAFLVHIIDDMDAKMNLMKLALEADQSDGKWTDRTNIFRRPLYKGTDGSE